MSKVGKMPIIIPEGVTVSVAPQAVTVAASKGEAIIPLLRGVKCFINDSKELVCELIASGKQARSNWGTMRALIQNAVLGLTSGFEKKLILEGVGYKISKEGENLSMSLGFSHPVKFQVPKGITFEVEKNSILTIKGFDKMVVGQTAAKIRAMKKPEPYKGKGFRYSDEVIRRKAGKKAAGSGAA